MAISGLVTAVVLSVFMAASAGAAEAERCDLGTKYRVSAAVAYHRNENLAFIASSPFRGAQLRVEAAPGLTQEWLQSRIETQIASGVCAFGVPNVKVDVASDGDHFSVQISGSNDRAAQEILRHAQQLVK
jgi:uncharacterized membrane protein